MNHPAPNQSSDSGQPAATPGRTAALTSCYRVVLILAFHTFLTSTACAQADLPAANPENPPADTAPPIKETPAAAAPAAAGPVDTTPSRYILEDDLTGYVASFAAVLSMRTRTTDPFGQLQDPDAKPVIKTTVAKTTRRAAPVQATPFSDIVRLIKVTTIMPKEKRFLVGSRSIKEGDTIPLTYRGKNMRVEVSSVNYRQIAFRNLDNGETANISLNRLPKGVFPGTQGITAPGMVPDRPDTPLEVDPANSTSPNTQNH